MVSSGVAVGFAVSHPDVSFFLHSAFFLPFWPQRDS